MLNVVSIMGRLVADPQLRQTTAGKNVASFRIACDRGRKDANGQNQADFLDVVAWEKTADFICRYFSKGDLIAVSGRVQSRQYQDKNGNNRQAVEIVAREASFCGEKKNQSYANESRLDITPGNERFEPIADDEGDLPF